MGKARFARVVDSPLFLICLSLAMSALTAIYYQAGQVQPIPPIAGHDWTKHPNTLLVSYPSDDCGCGSSPSDWVRAGIKQGLFVLVVSPHLNDDLNRLKKQLSSNRLAVTTNGSREIISRFSPRKSIAGVLLRNGQIIRHAELSSPPETFFNEETRS